MISALGRDHVQVTGIPHFTESPECNSPYRHKRQQHTDGFLLSLNLSKQLLKRPKSFWHMFTLFQQRLQRVQLSEQNHYTILPIKHLKCKLPTLSIVNGQLIRVTKKPDLSMCNKVQPVWVFQTLNPATAWPLDRCSVTQPGDEEQGSNRECGKRRCVSRQDKRRVIRVFGPEPW